MSRKPWDEFWLDLAVTYSARGTCPRLKVGALLVKNHRLIGAGYNGAPPGEEHCEDVGCQMVPCEHPLTGQLDKAGDWVRIIHPGGHCARAVHGERNALINALIPPFGATLYVTHTPCPDCAQLLKGAGVEDIRWRTPYSGQSTGEPDGRCRHGKLAHCMECITTIVPAGYPG